MPKAKHAAHGEKKTVQMAIRITPTAYEALKKIKATVQATSDAEALEQLLRGQIPPLSASYLMGNWLAN